MVDDERITRSEAGRFKYENEMEISPDIFEAPAKVTERMRQHIISKLRPESFQGENLNGHYVHGTSLPAIKPLWLGEGTIYTVDMGYPLGYTKDYSNGKNRWSLKGYATTLNPDGFRRMPGHYRGFKPESILSPIFLVLKIVDRGEERLSRRTPGERYWYDERNLEYYDEVSVKGIVLSKSEYISLKEIISDMKATPPEIRFGTPEQMNDPDYVQASISQLERKLQENNGEDLYKAIRGDLLDTDEYFTMSQLASCISNWMVRGVDKSKIVPIYDWDGNLLWPTEKDVTDSPVEPRPDSA